MKSKYVSISANLKSGIALVALLVLTGLPMGQVAFAQDQSSLNDRLERLERDIRTLNLQIAGRGGSSVVSTSSNAPRNTMATSGVSSGPAAAQLTVRMDAFEEDLRSVTGSIEELTFQISTMSRRLDKLVIDIDYRLTSLESGKVQTSTLPSNTDGSVPVQVGVQTVTSTGQDVGTNVITGTLTQAQDNTDQNGFSKTAGTLGTVSQSDLDATTAQGQKIIGQPTTEPSVATVTPTTPTAAETASVEGAILPEGTPRERYKYAFGLLRQANYDKAEVAFKAFIEQHGDDALVGNARYWLGETYYVRGAYVDAAGTFLEGYQSDPQGPKAPDTLVKLGMSLANLDKTTEACAAYGKVTADYPKASTGIRNTVKRERARIGCE